MYLLGIVFQMVIWYTLDNQFIFTQKTTLEYVYQTYIKHSIIKGNSYLFMHR